MDYNKEIREQIPNIMKKLLSYVDKFSTDYKITDVNVVVDDSDLTDINSYITTYSTCAFLVEINYTLNNGEERSFTIEIPRMIKGFFIIKGKYKLINSYLTDDTNFVLVGKYFRFYYRFSYNTEEGLFSYYDEDLDEDKILDYETLAKDYPHALELDERSSAKLKVMYDLDYFPTVLTKELVQELSHPKLDKDDAINKRLVDIGSIVISTLNREAFRIAKGLQYNFYKYGTISSRSIQNSIDQIFYNQGTDTSSIGTSPNVNPLSYDSMNDKILLENVSMNNVKAQKLNESMLDIIDPIVTPDNVNVNRINYLNKSVKMLGKDLGIKVLNKDTFEPEYIPYHQYLAKRVLPYRFFDHLNKKVISPFKVLENRKEKDGKDYDYIQCHPDERLSTLSRMIPMLNSTDSIRTSMAARMITQAVPLINPDKPRVMTGYESELSPTTDITFESNVPGKVLEVTQEKVVIDVNGIPKEYSIPQPNKGIYDVTSVYESRVKVGDTVTSGQRVISTSISKSGTKDLGVNALTAYMPLRGYNYEDGIIISESFAKRIAHYSIIDIPLNIRDKEIITQVLPVGSKVKSRDIIIDVVSEFKNKSMDKLMNLVKLNENIKRNNLVVPNNITEGYIVDIKYDLTNFEDPDNKIVNTQKLDEAIKNQIDLPKEIPAAYRYKLKDISEEANVTVRLLVYNKGTEGTKLSNYEGSKGVVTKVLPDDEMIKTIDGRVIDVVLNSDAVFARKNISQLALAKLPRIADKILELGRKEGLDGFKLLLKKYRMNNYASMSDDELNALLSDPNTVLNYVTGCYSDINLSIIEKWMQELNIEELTQVIDGKTKRPIRNPVLVGNQYLIKLFHLPEYYNKVFTDTSYEAPILGKGNIRSGGGQMQGEMEMNALAASDLDEYLYKERNKYSFRDASAISINLALAGVDYKFINDNL